MIGFILNIFVFSKNKLQFNKTVINREKFYQNENKINMKKAKFCKNNNMTMINSFTENVETWEIDFFSRPVVSLDGKKIWELIVVDKDQTFEHIEMVPNNLVNSKELKKRIKKLIDSRDIKPKIVKFFRSQMFNMITIALADLDLIIRPSRRTFALFKKITEREENVYPKMDGYKPFMRDLQTKETLKISPEKMPDTLKGDLYTFASIEKSEALKILYDNSNKRCFYSLPSDYLAFDSIPGLIIYSDRAKSLANWLDSLELYSIFCDIESKNIIIECGLDTQYLFARLSDKQYKEATFFERSKQKTKGVHFISIQQSPDKNDNLGFWLLNSQL